MRLSAPIYQLKRRAKLLARFDKIPLHEAQDRIAREEGFSAWSALSARVTMNVSTSAMLPRLADGDMLLLGARPGSTLSEMEGELSSSRSNAPREK